MNVLFRIILKDVVYTYGVLFSCDSGVKVQNKNKTNSWKWKNSFCCWVKWAEHNPDSGIKDAGVHAHNQL